MGRWCGVVYDETASGCHHDHMTWWQFALTAVVPVLLTASGLFAQQLLSLRGESVAANRDTVAKWHDRRYELVTECVELMHTMERRANDLLTETVKFKAERDADSSDRLKDRAAERLVERKAKVEEVEDSLERMRTMESRLRFVVSEEAGDMFSEYLTALDKLVVSLNKNPPSGATRSAIHKSLAGARRSFLAQVRDDTGAAVSRKRRRRAVADDEARPRTPSPADPTSAPGPRGSHGSHRPPAHPEPQPDAPDVPPRQP